LAAAVVLTLAWPAAARAQGNGPGTWQFEAGGGVGIPINSDLSDFAKAGPDFDVLIGYQIHERIGINVYGGVGLLSGKDDTEGLTSAAKFPDQDIWRYGAGAEVSLTKPGNALVALFGLGLGGATVNLGSYNVPGAGLFAPEGTVSTSFSTLIDLKLLYKVNPNIAVGAGAEWLLIFSADTINPARQNKTLSYLPIKAFVRWMQ
jgi:hypothetical protein